MLLGLGLWALLPCLFTLGVVVLGRVVAGPDPQAFAKKLLGDQAEKAAQAKALLGAETLPEGYHAYMTSSVPFSMSWTSLLLAPVTDFGVDVNAVRGGFFFTERRRQGGAVVAMYGAFDRTRSADYFEGRSDEPPGFGIGNSVTVDEQGPRGKLTLRGDELSYSAFRGTFSSNVDVFQSRLGPSLTALFVVECGDGKERFGTWYLADPDPSTPIAALESEGTPLDPAAVERFLGHFDFCR